MRRRSFTPLFAVISLLTSCGSRPIRSDIIQFIASFSITESRAQYKEAGYETNIVSTDENMVTRVTETLDFNIKDLDNISFEHRYTRYDNDVLSDTSYYKHVVKKEGQYYFVDNDVETSITSEQIISQYVTIFFYKSNFQEIYQYGMYMGDTLKTVMSDIQDYVTVDFDHNTLTYDIPMGVKKDAEGYDFEEILVVDNIGMLKSCYIKQTNTIVEMETNTIVYNVI